MGKKKSTTTQTQQQQAQQNQASSGNFSNTANYDWKTAPDTEDTSAYRAWRPQIDQGIGTQYESAKNRLSSSFVNPLGGYATPQMRDAQLRTGMRNLNQDEAQAFRSSYNDVNSQRGNQLAGLAALTRPQLVNTGNSGTYGSTSTGSSSGTMSGTGTTTQSGNLLGDLIGGGAMIGSSAIGGKNRRP